MTSKENPPNMAFVPQQPIPMQYTNLPDDPKLGQLNAMPSFGQPMISPQAILYSHPQMMTKAVLASSGTGKETPTFTKAALHEQSEDIVKNFFAIIKKGNMSEIVQYIGILS